MRIRCCNRTDFPYASPCFLFDLEDGRTFALRALEFHGVELVVREERVREIVEGLEVVATIGDGSGSGEAIQVEPSPTRARP